MPNHEEHCADSLRRYGKIFSEVHRWIDESCTILGSSHRKYRHDPCVTPFEAKAIFGDLADHVVLDHIRLDEVESCKSMATIWFQNTNFYEIQSVLPRIKFTVQSCRGSTL